MRISIQHSQKLAISLIFIANLLFYQFALDQKFTLTNIYLKRDMIEWAIEHYYFVTLSIYIIFLSLSVLLFASFTPNLVICAGYFYGGLPALLYSTLGMVIGYFLLYHLVILASLPFIRSYLSKNLAYKKTRQEFKQFFWSYALAIRFLPVLPAMLVNIVCAIFAGNPRTFVYSSILGSLPFIYILCSKGKFLADMDTNITILSADNVVSLSLLTLISTIPIIYKKLQRRARKKKKMVISG